MQKLMKRFAILSILLLTLIIQGCATTKSKWEIPPKPQREEIPELKTFADYAKVINYYEHLVQEWESWGETVTEIIMP